MSGAGTGESSGEIQEFWWARFGSFILDLKGDVKASLRTDIMSALKKDSRVSSVRTGPSNDYWDEDHVFYPVVIADDNDLMSGRDHIHSRRFGGPIAFTVHVPGKNQPRIHDESPTVEDYEVCWDGWTAVVAWRRNHRERYAPRAAGQVVVNVIRDAVESLAHSLMVQSCSPVCEHLFGHRDIKVEVLADIPRFELAFEEAHGLDPVTVRVGGPVPTEMITVILGDELFIPAAAFARVKNGARRILNIEQSLRRRTAALLVHDYEALQRADVGVWRTVGHTAQDSWAYLRGKGRGRPVRRLISEIWLQMAAIESLQRSVADARRDYDDATDEFATPTLFDGDLKDDEASVSTVDAGFARSAIENKSARMEHRGIVGATLVAAIIGSGVGAAIGGLFAG